MANSEGIRICDCTLVQGEKSPEMSFREKIELCRLLDRLNVDLIGLTAIRQKKIDALLIKSVVQAVSRARVAVPVLLDPENVSLAWEAVKSAPNPRLQVSAPVSSVQMEYLYHLKPAAMQAKVSEIVSLCASLAQEVEFIALDATRADPAFLRSMVSAALSAGAKVITFCDNAGVMLPEEITGFFTSLFADIPALAEVTVGFACSDALNLADACAIAAIRSGVREIKAAAFRTDSISLRNLVRILNARGAAFGVHENLGVEKIRVLTGQIENLCRSGLGHSFTRDQEEAPNTGDVSINAHESRDSVKKAIGKLGYDLSEEDIEKVWQRFSRLAEKKSLISLRELEAIIATEAMQIPPVYSDLQYVISTGSGIGAMSHMKLLFHGKPLEGVASGDGAIDAAFRSIEAATGRHFELDDFQIQSVTEGHEAMGAAMIRLRAQGKLYAGRGISTDIIGACIRAYLNALNKIVFEEG